MTTEQTFIPNILSIAGSDPSGGAGIQADLKTISALGGYAMAAITALTVQNTRGVSGIHSIPPNVVAGQIDAVFDDIRVDAVKVGMLGSASIVAAVADALARNGAKRIVVDPVMVAKSGARLLDPDAVAALRDRLCPMATVITPNLPEAADLLGRNEATDVAGLEDAARALQALGPHAVLVKGGHLTGADSPDILFACDGAHRFPGDRVITRNTHGTGCTLSSAIATLLPQRDTLSAAVGEAKAYVSGALRAAHRLRVGHGHGPTHHFHALWSIRDGGRP